jgi:hypothetical protein
VANILKKQFFASPPFLTVCDIVGIDSVSSASCEGEQYILKDILPGDFEHSLNLMKLVDGSAHVRTSVDSIPDRHMFLFPFLKENLQLVDTPKLTHSVKKNLIKDALTGLANLHDKSIYHTGRIPVCYYSKSLSPINIPGRHKPIQHHDGLFQTKRWHLWAQECADYRP